MANNTLTVSATDGVTAETRAQIVSYREAGVSEIAVLLTNTNLVDDKDLLDLVELEIREMLSSYDYDGDNATITRK